MRKDGTRERAGSWWALGFGSLALILMLWIRIGNLRSPRHAFPTGDLGSFWASGFAARHGLNPYAVYPKTWQFRAFAGAGPEVRDVNLNPPSSLPFFSLWSRLSLLHAAQTWAALSAVLLIVATAYLVHRYKPDGKQVLWLLLGGATLDTLRVMQVYTLLLPLVVIAVALLESDEDRWAGVAIGCLIAFKPNFAIWPILLALNGKQRVVLPAIGAASSLSLLPALLYGTHIYRQWAQAVALDNHWIFPAEVSLNGYFRRIGAAPVGITLAITGLLGIVAITMLGRPTNGETNRLALCGSILLSPMAWMHYILIAAPSLIANRWRRTETLAACLLAVPPIFVQPATHASKLVIAASGAMYSGAIVLLLWNAAKQPALEILRSRSRTPVPDPELRLAVLRRSR
jgi:hypothetical protein